MQEKKLLIIGYVWPEPKSSAAGNRMMQIIECFQQMKYQITFASPAAKSEFQFDLSLLNIQVESIQLNHSSFDTFITNLNPDVVLFDRFMMEEQFGWRVAEHCPDAVRLLDTEDLHCLRYARQLALKENRTFSTDDLFSDYAKREIASIYRCDLTLMVSEYEMELLSDFFKVDRRLIYYFPIVSEGLTDDSISNWKKFEERNNYLFIGNFYHEPNIDAVNYLKNEIWPLIKKKNLQSELHIYGAYVPQKISQLHNEQQGFIIKGRIENASDVFENYRVNLAPLRFGAGIKGKLLEGMFYGIPSVTTSIGAESMQGTFDWNGFIFDSPTEFADAAILLYSDQLKWIQAQKNGIDILNNRYSKNSHFSKFIAYFQNFITKIEAHRKNNFIGSMLLHHTLTSTKYMSRFIELKNKTN